MNKNYYQTNSKTRDKILKRSIDRPFGLPVPRPNAQAGRAPRDHIPTSLRSTTFRKPIAISGIKRIYFIDRL